MGSVLAKKKTRLGKAGFSFVILSAQEAGPGRFL
jgi:hypothetical protein